VNSNLFPDYCKLDDDKLFLRDQNTHVPWVSSMILDQFQVDVAI